MAHCPSCGRYTGPHEACPYCGARLTGRLPIRIVKITAILLATVGLAILWLAATHAEVPQIAIGQAGATMNMAYVRIKGRCTRSPSYDPESDYLSFWLEDDTGEIRVSAYRAETRQLIEQGHVPALGDLVEVAGTLRVREDFLSLTINVPEQMIVSRAAPVERAIGSIAPEDLYQRVRVSGSVHEVYEPYDGLTLITIGDETGAIPIAVGEDLIALSGVTPTLKMGQAVAVTATVSLYGDTPQLAPASTADLVALDQGQLTATESPRLIGSITSDDVGKTVTLMGTLSEPETFSAGVKFSLSDDSGAITLLLWQNVYDALPDADKLASGVQVEVTGEIEEYQGELEIIPEADDIRVTK